jgi:DNA polymerase-3 subunit alpha
VVRDIIAARGKEPFKDIYDFVERVPAGVVNRRTFDNLAMAGAFDCFSGIKREDFFEENTRGETFSEQLLRYGQRYQQNQAEQTASLFSFDDCGIDLNAEARPPIKPAKAWPDIERLSKERDLVGMYLSAHPLDPYFMELNYATKTTIKGLSDIEPAEDVEVTFGGMVASYETRPTRKGGTFGIMKIEDETGSTELRLFGENVFNLGRYGIPMTPVLVTCKWRRRFRDSDLSFDVINIRPLAELKGKLIRGITISLTPEHARSEVLELIKDQINSSKDDLGSLYLRIFDPEINRSIKLTAAKRIPINRSLINLLRNMEIEFNVETVPTSA